MLDIYAIEELRSQALAPTDDSSKYSYKSNSEGVYGKMRVWCSSDIFLVGGFHVFSQPFQL